MSLERGSTVRKKSTVSQKRRSQSRKSTKSSKENGGNEGEAKVLGCLQLSGIEYTRWQELFDDSDMDEVCYLMTEEIMNIVKDELYTWYMESQLIPFSVDCVHKAWQKLVTRSYMKIDTGRSNESWEPDDEVEWIPLDNWASNCLANVVFEEDPLPSVGEEEGPATGHPVGPQESLGTVQDKTEGPETRKGLTVEELAVPPTLHSKLKSRSFERKYTSSASSLNKLRSPFGRMAPVYIPPKMYPNNLVMVQSGVQCEVKAHKLPKQQKAEVVAVDLPKPSLMDLCPKKSTATKK